MCVHETKICFILQDEMSLTHDVELRRGVSDAAGVSCDAGVHTRVLRAHITNDQRAVLHLLKPEDTILTGHHQLQEASSRLETDSETQTCWSCC